MNTTRHFQLVKRPGFRQDLGVMKISRDLLLPAVLGILISLNPTAAPAQAAQPVVVTTKSTAPPVSAATGTLPASILAWDAESKTIEVHEGEPQGHLAFNFTNVSKGEVVISNVHPGCGCTTAQLPPLPWTNAPGANGRIGVTINITAHGTTSLYKTLTVTTDKGIKVLSFHVNILPLVLPTLTDAERARDLVIAQTNRQAVFQGECVTCHVKPGANRYGKELYDSDCGICHEGAHRLALAPDLHALIVPTGVEFWRNWVAHGKVGGLMPAFANAEGGPLNDLQINSLATWLNTAYPSKVAATAGGAPAGTPAPPCAQTIAPTVPAAPSKTP
jgi:mono/diheme cytochrome c family protein